MLTQTNCQLSFTRLDPSGGPPIVFSPPVGALAIRAYISWRTSEQWDAATPDHGLIYRFLVNPDVFYPSPFVKINFTDTDIWWQVISDPGDANGDLPYYLMRGANPAYNNDHTINYFYLVGLYRGHMPSWVL